MSVPVADLLTRSADVLDALNIIGPQDEMRSAVDLLDAIDALIRKVARDLYTAEVHRQGVGWDEHCTDLLVRSQHSLAEMHALLLHPKEVGR
jgi:hypothetical protein